MEKPLITFSQKDNIQKRIEALERDLSLLKARVRKLEESLRSVAHQEEPENVLLKEIDLARPQVVEILMDWVGFLLSRVGDEEFKDLMEYYVSIGWISRSVADLLTKYARGIRVESVKGYVTPEDHIKSLEYINRIREAMG